METIIRMRDLQKIIGLSRTRIYQWIAAGRFPEPVLLSDRTRRTRQGEKPGAVGWKRSEIEAWIAARPTAPLKQAESAKNAELVQANQKAAVEERVEREVTRTLVTVLRHPERFPLRVSPSLGAPAALADNPPKRLRGQRGKGRIRLGLAAQVKGQMLAHDGVIEEMIGPQGAAELMRCSPRAVLQMARAGSLPYVDFSRSDTRFRPRFRIADIRSYTGSLENSA